MAATEADARDAAAAQVQAWCGWHVAPSRTEELTLDGPGSWALVLPSLMVTAIASITEDGALLDPADYSWSSAGVVRRSSVSAWRVWQSPGARWTWAYRGVVVTLTHGHPEWPLEVAALIDRLAARVLDGSSVLTQVGQVAYATGADGAPLGGALTSSEAAVLAPYRLPKRA